jgi:nitrite reductase/ring-hydroxylating ferredoxin subunit
MPLYLCKVEEIGEQGKEVSVRADAATRYLMLFRHAETIRAYVNACPHQGRPLNCAPDHFLLSPAHLLVCAQHGACFNLETGLCLEGPCRGARLQAVPIQVTGGEVWLN